MAQTFVKTYERLVNLLHTVKMCRAWKKAEPMKKLSIPHEKAIHTPTTTLNKPSEHVCHSASLLFRSGCPLVEEELLLYALVCTSFPENGYNIKAKLAEKYDPINMTQ